VVIRSPADALRYVRLQTSSAARCLYWALQPEECNATEVVRTRDVGSLPNFGLVSLRGLRNQRRGAEGVLAETAFDQAHLTPAVAWREGGMFHVYRWVYVMILRERGPDERLEHVLEFVDEDGLYARTVEETRDLPEFQGFRLWMNITCPVFCSGELWIRGRM
jgi:hypothetical protein